MSSNKQIESFSITLNMVRTEKEKELSVARNYAFQKMKEYKTYLSTIIQDSLGVDEWNQECSDRLDGMLLKPPYKTINDVYVETYKGYKDLLHEEYVNNKDLIRYIDIKNIKDNNIIAMSSNNLNRTLGINLGEFTHEFITVEIGNMDDLVSEQVIKNGLYIGKDLYKFFTAGAGQTRKKKFMMIKQDTWDKFEKNLMCGLTINRINILGGMNISKFLAYLSLNNSSSEIWDGFDIDRSIVVDDFETNVYDEVDYIDRNDKADNGFTEYTITDKNGNDKVIKRKKTKVEWTIERKYMNVPVPHMDGCGIMLPSVCKKNRQVRLPWIKGLLTPTNYKKYATEVANNTKIKDIYGKEYDIIKDNIEIIFTKSQFKLWKYYKNIYNEDGSIFMTGWEVYKCCFKYYKCTCNICKEDEDKYKDMEINYQMLQQLTNLNKENIKELTKDFKELINKVHNDRKSQLEFLGATIENKHRNYMQEILRLYPEMLTSNYIKKQIKDTITSSKKKAKSGRIKIKGAKRMFLIPDVVAFMDWLFTGNEKPKGFLNKNEVYCNLYKEDDKLDLLRSPSLSFEHAIRENRRKYDKCEYFITNGMYTSTHDLISKILMFDVDGDETLVLNNFIIELAEQLLEEKQVRPLYYEMGKAGGLEINIDNIYDSLKFVYHKSNIGKVSNALTDLWNRDNPWQYYPIMQKLCAYNNDVIDSAKTLIVPKLPKEVSETIKNRGYVYFFQFAKNKKESECRPISDSVMDNICKEVDSIEKTEFDYSKGFGKFKIKPLLHKQQKFEYNYDIIKYYIDLEKETNNKINQYKAKNKNDEDLLRSNYEEIFYRKAREEILEYSKINNIEYNDVVDNIIKYCFDKDIMRLQFVFNVFGAVIINNLNKNLKLSIDNKMVKMCETCGKRIELKSVNSNQCNCKSCSKKIIQHQKNIWKKKNKEKNVK